MTEMDDIEFDVDDVDTIQRIVRACNRLDLYRVPYLKVNNYCVQCGHQSLDLAFCCTWCKITYLDEHDIWTV